MMWPAALYLGLGLFLAWQLIVLGFMAYRAVLVIGQYWWDVHDMSHARAKKNRAGVGLRGGI